MRATKRTVIIRSLWAFIFLLIALAPYAAVIYRTQEAAFVSPPRAASPLRESAVC
jgi:hypothetical protein